MDTIVAISTPHGSGGIAVVRISGSDAISLVQKSWRGADLGSVKSHTVHLGEITDADGDVLDQAVATVFRAPKSYTGEDTVELSIHGSKWIQRQVVERLIALGGRGAEPGEFTRRAFLNGRLDLAQAEGVADVIAASSRAAHRLAVSQMSGGFSKRLNELRGKLMDLASLLELELDFSEEEVEFADRGQLLALSEETLRVMERLASTYKTGKAFKEGVPVAIAGRPNAGKSTLLNALLDDDKAIVSDIPGTTRDVIDDTAEIGGILFRFYDTAGLRETNDLVEKIGIEKAQEVIDKASIILWLIDSKGSKADVSEHLKEIKVQINAHKDSKNIVLFNKIDSLSVGDCDLLREIIKESDLKSDKFQDVQILYLSALTESGISDVKQKLIELTKGEFDPESEFIVTNARHHAALESGAESLRRAMEAMKTGLSADLIAQDLREAISSLSEVTGAISSQDILATIFSRFCIGK